LKDGKSTTTVGKYLKLISRANVVGQKERGISITNNPVDLVERHDLIKLSIYFNEELVDALSMIIHKALL